MAQKDYYMILGVLPDAEDVVIKAAYKALIQRYHPDRFKGSAEEAQRRTTELNEAYEVLSNPSKRAAYDRERQAQHNSSTSDYDDDYVDDSSADVLEQDWAVALEFYPDLKGLEARLRRISMPLAIGFRQLLLSNKDFDKRVTVAQQLEKRFLQSYFGSNTKVVEFATKLIMDGKRDAAKELNKVIGVLGSKVDSKPVIDKIYTKYYAQEIAKEREESEAVSSFYIKFFFVFVVIFGIIVFLIALGSSKAKQQKAEQQKAEKQKAEQQIYEERKAKERNGDGTISDFDTKRQWMNCDIGQTWNGAICEGQSQQMGWYEANILEVTYAGHSDWRLPTKEELSKMRYCTSGHVYWSSHDLSHSNTLVYSCSMQDTSNALKTIDHAVRLVRNQ
jgi:curved DNA-binding protein CbpA